MSAFPRLGEKPQENRGRVVRMALIYVPVTLVSLALVVLAVFKIGAGESGFVLTLIIFGIIGGLTAPLAIQYIKDLSSRPIEYQGEIVKKWQKGNLLIFFMPSFYVAIDSRVLNGRVTRVVDEGCYVAMEDGSEGFVSRKELADEPPRSATETMQAGQEVKYKVLGVDGNGNYKLSCRRADGYESVTKLFSVPRVEYAMLLEHDLVKVTCYPHSATVERIERYDDVEKKFVPATDGADL